MFLRAEGYSRPLFDDMRVNRFGEWDLASDYVYHTPTVHGEIHIETKKKRMHGKIRYEVTVMLVRCRCKTKQRDERCSLQCTSSPMRSLNPDLRTHEVE
jgi:hypothetical protein